MPPSDNTARPAKSPPPMIDDDEYVPPLGAVNMWQYDPAEKLEGPRFDAVEKQPMKRAGPTGAGMEQHLMDGDEPIVEGKVLTGDNFDWCVCDVTPSNQQTHANLHRLPPHSSL